MNGRMSITCLCLLLLALPDFAGGSGYDVQVVTISTSFDGVKYSFNGKAMTTNELCSAFVRLHQAAVKAKSCAKICLHAAPQTSAGTFSDIVRLVRSTGITNIVCQVGDHAFRIIEHDPIFISAQKEKEMRPKVNAANQQVDGTRQ